MTPVDRKKLFQSAAAASLTFNDRGVEATIAGDTAFRLGLEKEGKRLYQEGFANLRQARKARMAANLLAPKPFTGN